MKRDPHIVPPCKGCAVEYGEPPVKPDCHGKQIDGWPDGYEVYPCGILTGELLDPDIYYLDGKVRYYRRCSSTDLHRWQVIDRELEGPADLEIVRDIRAADSRMQRRRQEERERQHREERAMRRQRMIDEAKLYGVGLEDLEPDSIPIRLYGRDLTDEQLDHCCCCGLGSGLGYQDLSDNRVYCAACWHAGLWIRHHR